jgi:hypothetical protein
VRIVDGRAKFETHMKTRLPTNVGDGRNGCRDGSAGSDKKAKTQRRVERDAELKRIEDWCAVLSTKEFSDAEDPDPRPIASLHGEASRDIEELTAQIDRCCSHKNWTPYQKRAACEQLVKLAVLSTDNVARLAKEFPAPFREIAEELPVFPCLFPAQAESVPLLQDFLWNKLNLGKRHELKLRGPQGRKTFSTKTWANRLLLHLIQVVHQLADNEAERDPGEKHLSIFREVAYRVPLTSRTAKKWLEAIWKALLLRIPNPEKDQRLRQLVDRPSLRRKRMRRDGTVGEKTLAHNIQAEIKRKLGLYLRRMLSDSAVHK